MKQVLIKAGRLRRRRRSQSSWPISGTLQPGKLRYYLSTCVLHCLSIVFLTEWNRLNLMFRRIMHILHFDSMLIQWKCLFHWTVTITPGLNSCNQLKMAEMMEAITVKSNEYISVVVIRNCSRTPDYSGIKAHDEEVISDKENWNGLLFRKTVKRERILNF